jgi:hypothetical protein
MQTHAKLYDLRDLLVLLVVTRRRIVGRYKRLKCHMVFTTGVTCQVSPAAFSNFSICNIQELKNAGNVHISHSCISSWHYCESLLTVGAHKHSFELLLHLQYCGPLKMPVAFWHSYRPLMTIDSYWLFVLSHWQLSVAYWLSFVSPW